MKAIRSSRFSLLMAGCTTQRQWGKDEEDLVITVEVSKPTKAACRDLVRSLGTVLRDGAIQHEVWPTLHEAKVWVPAPSFYGASP